VFPGGEVFGGVGAGSVGEAFGGEVLGGELGAGVVPVGFVAGVSTAAGELGPDGVVVAAGVVVVGRCGPAGCFVATFGA
jgi:hypothetical protein